MEGRRGGVGAWKNIWGGWSRVFLRVKNGGLFFSIKEVGGGGEVIVLMLC